MDLGTVEFGLGLLGAGVVRERHAYEVDVSDPESRSGHPNEDILGVKVRIKQQSSISGSRHSTSTSASIGIWIGICI